MNTLTISLTINVVLVARYFVEYYQRRAYEEKLKAFMKTLAKLQAELDKSELERKKNN